VNILKSFGVTDHEGVKRAISGALWNLEEKEKQIKVAITQQQTQGQGDAGHIMISYCWAQKDRMRQIGLHLKSLGFPIWIDIEQMEGSVLERMSEAVENSSVVVIGLSSNYKESQACRTEAEYAYRLKKEVVYVMAEDGYTPKGWLGAMLGNKLWYNPWGSAGGFEDGVGDVIRQLKKFASQGSTSAAAAAAANTAQTTAVAASPAPALVAGHLPVVAAASQVSLSYVGVKVPENTNPLDQDSLTLQKLQSWKVEEVSRWLRMVHLEALIPAFVFHEIGGTTLIELHQQGDTGIFKLWELLGLRQGGPLFDFTHHLKLLISESGSHPLSWGKGEVSIWLTKCSLQELVPKAQEENWDGAILHAFYKASQGEPFFQLCKAFKIESPVTQARLLSHLSRLFS